MPDYEHGDQIEVRCLLWWDAGGTIMNGRTVATWWRGDDLIDQQLGPVTVLDDLGALTLFNAAWVNGVWSKFLRESHRPRHLDSRRDP